MHSDLHWDFGSGLAKRKIEMYFIMLASTLKS